MISVMQAKRYCDGPVEEIENYAEAVKSPEKWDLHHRSEIQPDGVVLSAYWMKKHGVYYHVLPCQLVFVPHSEHVRMHGLNPSDSYKDAHSKAMSSSDVRHKMSESAKSRDNTSHRGPHLAARAKSVFVQLYGKTVRELADALGVTPSVARRLHLKGELQPCH